MTASTAATTTSASTVAATRTGPDTGNAASVTRAGRQTAVFVGLSLGVAAIGGALAAARVAPDAVPFLLATGPTIIAAALAAREGGLRRLFEAAVRRPTNPRWYLALLLPVAATAAVIPIAVGLGSPSTGLFDKVLPNLFVIPFVVLIPAFAEEIAWRGFALNRLLTVMPPLTATMLLAVPWIAMHLALFLPGQMYEGIAVWPSIVGVGALAIITSFLYIRTGRSVLITGLFHALFNGVTPLMSGIDTDTTWELRAVVVAAIALAILFNGGFRGTDRRPAAVRP